MLAWSHLPEASSAAVEPAAQASNSGADLRLRPRAEPAEFRAFFQEHAPFAWRSLVHFGLAADVADDACQDVFVVAYQKLTAGFVPESARAWLYGVCWRVAAKHRKRSHVRRERSLSDHDDTAADSSREPGRALEERRRLEQLDRALEQLPDEQRAVFVLYEIEQLAMREVAEALEISINTAFSRLYSARRKVAAALGVPVPEGGKS